MESIEYVINMKKWYFSLIAIVCLLLTACDEDKIFPGNPMVWTYDISTPDGVKWEWVSGYATPEYYFKINAKGGDMVMICDNYDSFTIESDNPDFFDCGWMTVKKIRGNWLEFHFPYNDSGAPDASEQIKIFTKDGKRTARTIIHLNRTFEKKEQSGQEPLPEEAKFKMIKAGFTPFMNIDSPLPASLDLVTFRITDMNGNYSPLEIPKFTQHYDSIVWSAEGFPHTFRVYDSNVTVDGAEEHIITQWSTHFFKNGKVKNHLKGYRDGKVKHEALLDVVLYGRDFLGIKWGTFVLQNPQNLTTYCLLDTTYEYQVNDIVAKDNHPYSRIIPVNHKLLTDSEFLKEAQKAIKTLMGEGQSAAGKESLFKCLPKEGIKTELYWENKTTRMIMVHQLPDNLEELVQEKYYLHIEPRS